MRKFLLYSSVLVLGLSGRVAEAACIQTPTCSSLGYTSTSSCTGGVKCPFGNYWNCTASDLNDKITEQTNKITELETQITELKKEMVMSNCQVGDILYSDMSCDPNIVSGKTPIGVVFDRTKKLAIGLDIELTKWSEEYFDVPGVDNITNSTKALLDMDGKKNTSTVLEYCKANNKSCPAFEYVNSYKTEGTNAGDWYLPAAGELNAMFGNRDVLENALYKVDGLSLTSRYYWSSSEYSNNRVWVLDFSNGLMYFYDKDEYFIDNRVYVRPVLAF